MLLYTPPVWRSACQGRVFSSWQHKAEALQPPLALFGRYKHVKRSDPQWRVLLKLLSHCFSACEFGDRDPRDRSCRAVRLEEEKH